MKHATDSTAILAAMGDDVVVAAAQRLAARYSCAWGMGTVEIDTMHLVLCALCKLFGDAEGMRRIVAEQPRVTKALMALGLLVKEGRGKRARFVLAPVEQPPSALVASVVAAELRANYRVEATCQSLARESKTLALLGLEGERARDALRRADGSVLVFGHLAGVERVHAAWAECVTA